jgi:hypothetical protein
MKLNTLLFLFIASLFYSCDLKPIQTEFNLQRTFSVPVLIGELDNGKILIYNGAGFNNKIDNSSFLNVWINNKPLGQLMSNEFAVIYLLPGKYEFKLVHKDIKNFTSNHTLEITEDSKIICVRPTITSNKAEITNIIPDNFHLFRNIIRQK